MVKIFDLLANKNNYGSTRVLDNIKYIVIHEAKDDNINSVNDFQKNNLNKSVHYYVNKKSINKCVSDENIAYSVSISTMTNDKSARNSNSISIMISKSSSTEVMELAAELIAEKMKQYNISIDNILRHYDLNCNVKCPSSLIDDDKWKEFKELIVNKMQ